MIGTCFVAFHALGGRLAHRAVFDRNCTHHYDLEDPANLEEDLYSNSLVVVVVVLVPIDQVRLDLCRHVALYKGLRSNKGPSGDSPYHLEAAAFPADELHGEHAFSLFDAVFLSPSAVL